MGLFDTFRRTLARTRVAQEATQLIEAGDEVGAYMVAKGFLNSDARLMDVIDHFNAQAEEISHIYWSMLAYSEGQVFRGHAIAISTLLELETLAYMLRATRGQVDKDEAYELVMEHFQTSRPYFRPEREYRLRHGM